MKLKRLDPSVVSILVSLSVVAGGFLLARLTELLTSTSLWIAFGLVAVFVTLTVYMGFAYVLPAMQRELVRRNQDMENSLTGAVTRMETRFREIEERLDVARPFEDSNWLLTTKELVALEASLPQKEVWIVSAYLGGELQEGLFAPTIRANTDRGIVYYYVIPDDPQTEARVQAIRSMVQHRGRIKTIVFPEEKLFNLLSAHDTCVFDPFERGDNACTGYMNVVTSVRDKDYFIRLGPQYCQRLIATVRRLGLPMELAQDAAPKAPPRGDNEQ